MKWTRWHGIETADGMQGIGCGFCVYYRQPLQFLLEVCGYAKHRCG